MKNLLLLLLVVIGTITTSKAQFVYKIKADSVIITNDSCTAELIIENSTKNVKGFLVNKGNGRTEFRKATQLTDSSFSIAGDTIVVRGGSLWQYDANNNLVPKDFSGTRVQITDSLFGSTIIASGPVQSNSSFDVFAPSDNNSWSELNIWMTDTAKRQMVVGHWNTPDRNFRDGYISIGDSYSYTEYPENGSGMYFDIRTGQASEHRTFYWRNGNVGIGSAAGTYRLTHKLAVLGKGIFTDTLTAPVLNIGGTVINGNSLHTVFLGADISNSNATANTFADVSGLSFPVEAAGKYKFKFFVVFSAAATTTGSRWSINGPSLTALNAIAEWTNSTTTSFKNVKSAYDGGSSTSNSITSNNIATIEGVIQCSANGNIIARFASAVASSSITAKAGLSYVEYQRID